MSLGGLLGLTVGFGRKWGIFIGLLGAVALIPFLGFGFIGIPFGLHWKKKIGIGLIFPFMWPAWWICLVVGIVMFLIGLAIYEATKD